MKADLPYTAHHFEAYEGLLTIHVPSFGAYEGPLPMGS